MMRVAKKPARLDELENLLLTNPRGLTIADLVRRLECHRATVYRYLDELSALGVPVVHEEDGGLWWIDTTRYISNIHLRSDESLVLYLAARRLVRQTHAATPAILSALEKLATALRQPTAQQLIQITRRLYERTADAQRTHVWETLTQAWLERRVVRITHHKFQYPVPHTYTIHPYVFEPSIWGEGTYLISYCIERDHLRTFKIERIDDAVLLHDHFDIPPDLDADLLLRHAWGIWYEEDESPVHVRVRFLETVAQRVKETVWHPSQVITPLSDGGIYWEVDVSGEMELVSWIRSWGPDAEVLDPPSLRQRIAEDLRQAALLYG